MARHKEEVIEETKEDKSTKATAVALFKSFPEEVQKEINSFVKQIKTSGETAKHILELATKYDLPLDQIAHVIKEQMKMLGLKPPNVNGMLGISKALPQGGAVEEAASKAAEEEEAGLPFISVPLGGLNREEIKAGLTDNKVMNIYYSEEDYKFVRIEFA